MQDVQFKTIDDFLDYLPADELRIVQKLRTLVLDCIPECTEKLSYNVPFYKRKKNICFIWPASVLWGNTKTYTGVRFGFTSGYLLQDAENYLVKENRKQVYWRDFTKLNAGDMEILRSYLFEAVEIDKMQRRK